ncbi:sodium/solute symporter [bacterium]|nr:sodium/solute symporter [bacterium]
MFSNLDYVVIVSYLMLVSAAGFWFGRREKTTSDFFLAGRQMPWGAVMFSILATEMSALTFIAVPGEAFKENLIYFQFAIGSLIGRILIALFFLPAFYRGKVTTVYQYLQQRFGDRSRDAGAIFFFVTRLLGSGVRLCVTAKAIEVVSGVSYFQAICVVAILAVAYTSFGGIKAVIWTDVIQFAVFIGGAVLTMFLIVKMIPGGLHGAYSVLKNAVDATGEPAHKLRVFDFTISLTKPGVLFIAILNSCFQTFAALGTDQDLTQRMLTCKDVGPSKKSLILTGIAKFPIDALFLLLGAALFAFNVHHRFAEGIEDSAHVFPTFIVTALPAGVKGLLFTAVFAAAMSSLDSALNALSSSAITDIYKPYIKKDAPERHYLTASRICVAIFAVLLVGIAYLCRGEKRVLWLAFKLTGFTYGAMLGVFLTGVFTRRGNNVGNIIAMISSIVVLLAIRLVLFPSLNWQFYVIIGTLWTFGVAVLFKPSAKSPGQPTAPRPSSR